MVASITHVYVSPFGCVRYQSPVSKYQVDQVPETVTAQVLTISAVKIVAVVVSST